MWPRSQTSGLIIGECTASSSASLRWATSSSVRSRASLIAESSCSTSGERGLVLTARAAMGWLCCVTLEGKSTSPCKALQHPPPQRAGIRGSLAGVVPAGDDRPAVLVSERAQGSRGQAQASAARGLQRDPAGAEHPQHVAVGEDGASSVDAGELGDRAVGARADLGRALASGAAGAPQIPVGALDPDLPGCQSLVLAVVPLEQILANLRLRAQPAQLACFACTPGRAHEHTREAQPAQTAGQRPRRLTATVGQRNIGTTGVAPVAAPLGLGVAHQEDLSGAEVLDAHPGPGGAAGSSTITLRRSRVSRLAGTWRLSSPSIALTASALPAPVASSRQPRAARSTARLSVMRSGGGLGESVMGRQMASGPASSVSAPGNREAMWASGPIPRTITSSTGGPAPSDGRPSISSCSYLRAPSAAPSSPCILCTRSAGMAAGFSSVSAARR